MLSLLNTVILLLWYYTIYRACIITVVEYFGRIWCLLNPNSAAKPGERSSLDWQESEMMNGFNINYDQSQ